MLTTQSQRVETVAVEYQGERVTFAEQDLLKLIVKVKDIFKILHDIELVAGESGKIVKSSLELKDLSHDVLQVIVDTSVIVNHYIHEIQENTSRIIQKLSDKLKIKEFITGFTKKGGFLVLVDRISRLNGDSLDYGLSCLVMGIEYGIKMEWEKSLIQKLIGMLEKGSVQVIKLLCFMIEDEFSRDKVVEILDNFNVFPSLVSKISIKELQVDIARLICGIVRSTKDDSKRSSQIYDLDDLGFRIWLLKEKRNLGRGLQVYFKEFEILTRREFYRRSQMKVSRGNKLHLKAIDQILMKFQKILQKKELKWMDLGVEDPFREFEYVGVLGLECLYYAAKKDEHLDKAFQTQYLAKKEKLCPILRASSQVVHVLSNYWGLFYEDYHVDSVQSYFLNFENIFVLALKPFFRIWTLMEASNDLNSGDLEKVTLLFKDHFYRRMSLIETSPAKSMAEIEIVLNEIDLEKIQQDMISDFVQIKKDFSLKDSNDDECRGIISTHRITCLKRGSWFFINNLKSEKVVCYRLSADEQYLYYQDFPEILSSIPSIDELHSFVRVEDINSISLSLVDVKTKNSFQFTVSGFDHESIKEFELTFITNLSSQFVEWYEGLCLVGKKAILQNDLPYNGAKMVSILRDLKSCIDPKTSNKLQRSPTNLPNFDFFYKDLN